MLEQAYFGKCHFSKTKFDYWYGALNVPIFGRGKFRQVIYSYFPTVPKYISSQFPLYSLRVSGIFYEVMPDGSKGRLFMFRQWKGKQQVFEWTMPRYHNSALDKAVRRRFAKAMEEWKKLSEEEKRYWEKKAKRRYKYKCMPWSAWVSYFIKTHPIEEFL